MLNQFSNDYLKKNGWHQSLKAKGCVDVNNNPIPWYTYPSLKVLNQIIKPHHTVFEYGSGNSSKWWTKKLLNGNLTTVEHDKNWYNKVHLPTTKLIEANSKVNQGHYPKLQEFYKIVDETTLWGGHPKRPASSDKTKPFKSYACELYNHDKFDIIIVDGMARVLATWIAKDKLKDDGFIVFDNSDRSKRYHYAFEFLKEAGYRRIDFWGPGPLNPYEWCTSIYTKNLDIFK